MAKKEKQQAELVQEATAPAAQQEQPSLNLQDLILVAQIIQICSSRGAFKADELANVGNLYTKLVAFLQSTGALTPAAEFQVKITWHW
jgi:hypothetical protein